MIRNNQQKQAWMNKKSSIGRKRKLIKSIIHKKFQFVRTKVLSRDWQYHMSVAVSKLAENVRNGNELKIYS